MMWLRLIEGFKIVDEVEDRQINQERELLDQNLNQIIKRDSTGKFLMNPEFQIDDTLELLFKLKRRSIGLL